MPKPPVHKYDMKKIEKAWNIAWNFEETGRMVGIPGSALRRRVKRKYKVKFEEK